MKIKAACVMDGTIEKNFFFPNSITAWSNVYFTLFSQEQLEYLPRMNILILLIISVKM